MYTAVAFYSRSKHSLPSYVGGWLGATWGRGGRGLPPTFTISILMVNVLMLTLFMGIKLMRDVVRSRLEPSFVVRERLHRARFSHERHEEITVERNFR